MKIKTFLVDLDGVVVSRAGYFSERVKEMYPDANHDAIKEFFVGGLYARTTLGEVGLEEALSKMLESWGTKKSVKEILNEWFQGENTINQEVLDLVQDVRKQGISCVIATDHSEYRKDDVWNNLGMKEYFDGIISSSDIGVAKDEPEFFIKSMKILGIENPESVLFTDDDLENVTVASELGLQGIVFTGISSLKEFNFKNKS